MRKAPKPPNAAEYPAEYDARRGIRGKHATRHRALDPDTAELLHVWAPLVGFRWSGAEHQVSDDMWIKPGRAYRGFDEAQAFKYALSEEERERCREIGHWLLFTHARTDGLTTRAKISGFLLSLWIVRRTSTNIPFRFETAESESRLFARMLDRFQWLPERAAAVTDHDLNRVDHLMPPLRSITTSGRRLRTALALTFRGCVASEWQSAFMCFAASAESILVFSASSGIAGRLADTYARLVTRSVAERRIAEQDFKRLYALRSDIVHGRSYARQDPAQNVEDLTRFADVLRRLWGVILESHELRTALDGDDRRRQALFASL